MKIAIAAGGTGGHIIPALAVAEELKANGVEEVFFIGTGKEIEKKLINASGFNLFNLPFAPVLGKGFFGFLKFLLIFPLALSKALYLFLLKRPQVVIGFGGYPSFLPVLVAFSLRIPRVIHEQNVKVGLANKVLSLISNKVFSVERAEGFLISEKKVSFIGNPVRKEFFCLPPWKPQVAEGSFNLLVIGGSQGASRINACIRALAEFLRDKSINLVHQVGEKNYLEISKHYQEISYSKAKALSYIEDIAEQYTLATLIISRAGAMSVAEISAIKRPAIFIPLPIAKAHQKNNINFLLENKAAFMLEQNEDLEKNLKQLIEDLIANPQLLNTVVSNMEKISATESSAKIMADEVLKLLK